ncbi:hypothetical protein PCC6912_32350 [Chlorogloeopsis fritschii PCC 6912]|uniref:Glycosyltransferase RgtA/B/C/D-like domain-containing protein n=1 Tax=Chlorogloeopsis fritschii PCC 6912 TaxID=211165 RepID=A0A3S0ZTZ5_CHLFR|nr:hypothetical protein [Chlorogloeopsis fritschii]RUR79699.1 hypothetical protein PCC6912_32350 [Chlorogloeopsis fritschii PCC 6912]
MLKQKLSLLTLKQNSANIHESITLNQYDFIAIFLAVIVGIILSIMPHILWLFKTGDFTWIADNDDLLYLSTASTAYHNHIMSLGDPVVITGGSTVYPWIQLIPGVILAKLFALNPININFIWRIWAGISVSTGWYLVTRVYLKNSWVALGVTVIFMTDIGINSCSLIFNHFITATNIAVGNTGGLLQTNPKLLDQWRLITPGMSMVYLLVHIWLFRLALTKPTRNRIILAAASFGVLFYVYFYFWTAATFALLIGILLDDNHRKTYLSTGILGIIFGLPQVIINALVKNSSNKEWLPRIDFFLPIPHFSELLIPKLALSLLFLTFLWVIFRRKDLIHLWALAASALLLTNHQIVTGLQIQNFHWNYCYGPVISLLLIVIVTELIPLINFWKKPLLLCGIALSSLYITTGIWLRSVEVTQTKESVELTNNYHKYYQQRFKDSNFRLEPRAVVAGKKEFVDFAVIMENQRLLSGYSVMVSPTIDNAEWDARIALNAYLEGIDRSSFIVQQKIDLMAHKFGPWRRNKQILEERVQSRQKYFDEIVADPVKAFKKFQVKYVALSQNAKSPEYLKLGWKLQQNGAYWQVWENKL